MDKKNKVIMSITVMAVMVAVFIGVAVADSPQPEIMFHKDVYDYMQIELSSGDLGMVKLTEGSFEEGDFFPALEMSYEYDTTDPEEVVDLLEHINTLGFDNIDYQLITRFNEPDYAVYVINRGPIKEIDGYWRECECETRGDFIVDCDLGPDKSFRVSTKSLTGIGCTGDASCDANADACHKVCNDKALQKGQQIASAETGGDIVGLCQGNPGNIQLRYNP